MAVPVVLIAAVNGCMKVIPEIRMSGKYGNLYLPSAASTRQNYPLSEG
jgi:hypothetical protein